MKLNPINLTPFSAKIVRESRTVKDSKTGEPIDIQTSRKSLIKSYDSQIRTIENAKQRALELDTFMHSNEIEALAGKLPLGDEIEVSANFCAHRYSDDLGQLKLYKPSLTYNKEVCKTNPRTGEKKYLNVFYDQFDPYKRGRLDKEGIVEWLQSCGDKKQ